MKMSLVYVAIVIGLMFPASARTQESQSTGSQDVPQVSNSRPSPGDAAVDGQGIKNYLLGPGDVLDAMGDRRGTSAPLN